VPPPPSTTRSFTSVFIVPDLGRGDGRSVQVRKWGSSGEHDTTPIVSASRDLERLWWEAERLLCYKRKGGPLRSSCPVGYVKNPARAGDVGVKLPLTLGLLDGPGSPIRSRDLDAHGLAVRQATTVGRWQRKQSKPLHLQQSRIGSTSGFDTATPAPRDRTTKPARKDSRWNTTRRTPKTGATNDAPGGQTGHAPSGGRRDRTSGVRSSHERDRSQVAAVDYSAWFTTTTERVHPPRLIAKCIPLSRKPQTPAWDPDRPDKRRILRTS